MKPRGIKYLAAVAALFLMAACQKDERNQGKDEPVPGPGREMSFYAGFDAETKTVLQEDGSIYWSPSDSIQITAVYESGKYAGKGGLFVSDALVECATTKFTGSLDYSTQDSIKYYFALYPYSNSYSYGVRVISEQTSKTGTFSTNHFPAAAVTETNQLKFKNLCGGFKITVSKSGIRKIVLNPINKDKCGFAGTAEIHKSDSISESQLFKGFDVRYTEYTDLYSGITLTVEGGGEFEPGKAYYATAIPQHVIGGITIDYYSTDSLYRFVSEKDFDIVRSKFGKLENLDAKAKTFHKGSNSYIASKAGTYSFYAVKGNSMEPVDDIKSVKVLWESYGTSTAPVVGDIISSVSYSDGKITYTATDKKGNAVIAVKDGGGNILWSWHIWCTDQPMEQFYNHGAGTMMDRNLGATSAIPGDVGALGLLYQWGRKDPFLGSSSISTSIQAKSTGTWESAVSSTSSTGTFAYAVKHPMQFITHNNKRNWDWYYTGSSSTDNTRWQTSDKEKGLYDPCPRGWRVPDGAASGVWSTAFGRSSPWTTESNWDAVNRGMDFGKTDRKLVGTGSDRCWYPSAGYLYGSDGSLNNVGNNGDDWSCTPYRYYAYDLFFNYDGYVHPSGYSTRADGHPVRCVSDSE